MRTGSEMVRGLKENLQAKQAKQKKKEKKNQQANQVEHSLGRKLCGEDCRIRFDAGQQW